MAEWYDLVVDHFRLLSFSLLIVDSNNKFEWLQIDVVVPFRRSLLNLVTVLKNKFYFVL